MERREWSSVGTACIPPDVRIVNVSTDGQDFID